MENNNDPQLFIYLEKKSSLKFRDYTMKLKISGNRRYTKIIPTDTTPAGKLFVHPFTSF